MSFEATQRAWAIRGLTAPQRLVLLRLAEHAGPDSCAWPSIRLLIEYTELSERTVRDALRALEAAGHIKTEHRQNERGNPISNRYRLLMPLIINGAPDAPPVNGAPAMGQELPGYGAAFAQDGAPHAPSYIESSIEPIKEPIKFEPFAVRPVGILSVSWKKLSSACAILRTPRASLTPCGLPPAEERALASSFAEAQTMGYQPSDVEALADWVNAGKISMRASPRMWLCQNLCTALADAEAWRKSGREGPGKGRAPPRQDQLTTSKTQVTREIRGVEGLRAIGINVPEGAIEHGPASESDGGNDKPF